MSEATCFHCGSEFTDEEQHVGECPAVETAHAPQPAVQSLTAFVVLVGDHGQTVVYNGPIAGFETQVPADDRMILAACRELVGEFESALIADKVRMNAVPDAQSMLLELHDMLVNELTPVTEPTPHQRVMDRLAERQQEQ